MANTAKSLKTVLHYLIAAIVVVGVVVLAKMYAPHFKEFMFG